MARIRTIKPAFFRHVDLFDAERETGLPLRVAFAGLWTVCDREGRFCWEPRTLKLDCLPHDDVDFSRVLDALTTRGFVVRYVVDGRHYGYVPTFLKHQIINNREAPSDLPEPNENNTLTRAPRVDDACPTPLNLDQGEGKGREQEGKGRERTKRRVTDASAGGQIFERFWEAYPKRGTASNPKKPARDRFDRLVRDGTDPEIMIAAAKRFCAIEREAGRYGTEKVAQALTWLNQSRYADYAESAPARSTGPPAPGLPSDEDLRRKYARTDEGPRASMAGDAWQDQESGSAPVFPGGEGVHRGERPAVCAGAGNGGMRGLGEILRSHRLVPGGIPGDAGSDPGRGEADDDGPGSVAGMV